MFRKHSTTWERPPGSNPQLLSCGLFFSLRPGVCFDGVDPTQLRAPCYFFGGGNGGPKKTRGRTTDRCHFQKKNVAQLWFHDFSFMSKLKWTETSVMYKSVLIAGISHCPWHLSKIRWFRGFWVGPSPSKSIQKLQKNLAQLTDFGNFPIQNNFPTFINFPPGMDHPALRDASEPWVNPVLPDVGYGMNRSISDNGKKNVSSPKHRET